MSREGFVPIPNKEHEAIMRSTLKSEEHRIISAVQRKSHGWHLEQAAISLTEFAKLTGMKRQSCTKALRRLVKKKIILVDKSKRVNLYRVNPVIEEWLSGSHTACKPHGFQKGSHTASKSGSHTASIPIYNRHNRQSSTYRGSNKKSDVGSHEQDELRESMVASEPQDEDQESAAQKLERYRKQLLKFKKHENRYQVLKQMIADLECKTAEATR